MQFLSICGFKAFTVPLLPSPSNHTSGFCESTCAFSMGRENNFSGHLIKYWSNGPPNATYTDTDDLSRLPARPACCHMLLKQKTNTRQCSIPLNFTRIYLPFTHTHTHYPPLPASPPSRSFLLGPPPPTSVVFTPHDPSLFFSPGHGALEPQMQRGIQAPHVHP